MTVHHHKNAGIYFGAAHQPLTDCLEGPTNTAGGGQIFHSFQLHACKYVCTSDPHSIHRMVTVITELFNLLMQSSETLNEKKSMPAVVQNRSHVRKKRESLLFKT